MKERKDLIQMIRQIDRKSYGSYKMLKGEYKFCDYILCIDHVQGDPFASPSRVRLKVFNQGKMKKEYFCRLWRKTAAEDFILRLFWKNLNQMERESMGSGKSGFIGILRAGQEMLERTAVHISEEYFEVRLEIGFPAFGRTIAGDKMEEIIERKLPWLVQKTFLELSRHEAALTNQVGLSDNQEVIRRELKNRDCICFVADGSTLPRESGVSEKPHNNAVKFQSPEEFRIRMALPFSKDDGKLPEISIVEEGSEKNAAWEITGMGIRKGITLIVGGGYHGKSTLLKAIERGVYPHIEGDGREYVVTDATAVKLRAEEGRFICREDISPFISNLPNKTDTTCFSTENASGSTSQAANTIEAVAAGSRVFLIDEDTTATNFMVRDERMAKLVAREKEPICPFIHHVKELYEASGISTVLVVGSSGEFFGLADTVLLMDEYHTRDVTAKAKEIAKEQEGNLLEEAGDCISEAFSHWSNKTEKDGSILGEGFGGKGKKWIQSCPKQKQIEKIKSHDWDELLLGHAEIDLRYLEQIVDHGQTRAIGHLMRYVLEKLADGKKNPVELAEELYRQLEEKGFSSVISKVSDSGSLVLPRKYEFLACLLRYRELEKAEAPFHKRAAYGGNLSHKTH